MVGMKGFCLILWFLKEKIRFGGGVIVLDRSEKSKV